MKKIIAMALSLLMTITVAPMAVSAEDNEAKIGDTKYALLSSAINDAKAGDTITVLKDCNGTSYVQGSAAQQNGKTVLDLNGHTVTLNASRWLSLQTSSSNYDFTIKNGTIVVPETIKNYEGIIAVRTNSTVTLENLDIDVHPASVGGTYGDYVVISVKQTGSLAVFKNCNITVNSAFSATSMLVRYNGGSCATEILTQM